MKSISKESSKDFAQSIRMEVAYRMLEVLCSSGPKKITTLAMLSGLNHSTCKKYSKLLEILM